MPTPFAPRSILAQNPLDEPASFSARPFHAPIARITRSDCLEGGGCGHPQ